MQLAPEIRLWREYEVDENGCWIVRKCLVQGGYSKIRFRGKVWGRHRLSWFLTYGPIPEGLNVLHSCDRANCINPDHLFLGTHKANMRDAVSKGRMALGERNGKAKLTPKQILKIRRDPRKQQVIAKEYGVSRSRISFIKTRRNWSHLK